MTKALWMFLYGLLAVALQGIVGHLGVPDPFMPQVMVVLVIALSFSEVNAYGCCMAFILGLLLDFSSAVLIGPWAGSLVVIFCALALLSQRLFIDSGLAAMFITFVSVVVANLLFSAFGSEYPVLTWEYPQKVFGQAATTAILSPLILSTLSRRTRRVGGAIVGGGTAITAV